MTYSVWTALRFAVLILILAGRLDPTVASTLCTIDNVLVEGSVDTSGVSMTEVNVRALGHCHNNDTVATILKTANTKKVGKTASMHTQLTTANLKYGSPYRRSCRDGLLKSIYTKDGGQDGDGQSANKVQAHNATDVFLPAGWRFRHGRCLSRRRIPRRRGHARRTER